MNLTLARALACDPERRRVRPLDGGDPLEVRDTVVDGHPRHPELLEADFPRIAAHYQGQATA